MVRQSSNRAALSVPGAGDAKACSILGPASCSFGFRGLGFRVWASGFRVAPSSGPGSPLQSRERFGVEGLGGDN